MRSSGSSPAGESEVPEATLGKRELEAEPSSPRDSGHCLWDQSRPSQAHQLGGGMVAVGIPVETASWVVAVPSLKFNLGGILDSRVAVKNTSVSFTRLPW